MRHHLSSGPGLDVSQNKKKELCYVNISRPAPAPSLAGLPHGSPVRQSCPERAVCSCQGPPINAGAARRWRVHACLLGSECEKTTAEMSLLERSLETIIDTFHQYSTKAGHPDTLNKREFRALAKTELPNFLKCGDINDIMEDLDTNQDQQLSFEEVSMLFARLTNASHEKMHEGHHRGHDHSHGPGLGEGGQSKGCH
ncbi:PREDICTED: protein S100-A9 isoform X2 [Chinchilla lanigera]|uniref:protein S100-A9 isoform X2 n=1 Tax=Chinchilla lanigera TaxID=34839 RepID=UPI000699176E|nr:PREDICTED: protein S100-A9 isoform X2 [Chinchilla lanigera]